MTLSQRLIAEVNAALRAELGPDFMGAVNFNLGLSPTQCKVDIRHCMQLDASAGSLTLIDREPKTAVK